MKSVPVSVECYSGYKADEYPKTFILENRKYEITEIIDRWYQGNLNPEYPAADYFKVTTIEGLTFILKHDFESDLWYIIHK